MEKRTWSDIDVDEQEYLDLLAQYGEGFVDIPELIVNVVAEKTGETNSATG